MSAFLYSCIGIYILPFLTAQLDTFFALKKLIQRKKLSRKETFAIFANFLLNADSCKVYFREISYRAEFAKLILVKRKQSSLEKESRLISNRKLADHFCCYLKVGLKKFFESLFSFCVYCNYNYDS